MSDPNAVVADPQEGYAIQAEFRGSLGYEACLAKMIWLT